MSETKNTRKSRDQTTLARRRLIVESAAICFIEKGFHQTSVRDIANQAGISLGNLYNHFDSKADLIAEIAGLETEELGEIEAALSEGTPPLKALERFAEAYFEYVAAPENVVLAAEITAEAMRNPQIADGFIENRKRLAGLLGQVLASGADTGEFRLAGSPDETANLLIDLVEAAGLRTAFEKPRQRARTIETALAMIRKMILA